MSPMGSGASGTSSQRETLHLVAMLCRTMQASIMLHAGFVCMVEPEGLVPTGPPERGSKHPKKDDAYKVLLQKETERAEVQIHLAEEQLILARLQQTKARLEIRLLKAKLGQAGLSTADEADDDDEEEELIRRTTHKKN